MLIKENDAAVHRCTFSISEALLRQLYSQTYCGIYRRGNKHLQAITLASDVWLILKVLAAPEKTP